MKATPEEVTIKDEFIRTENKYLTKLVFWAVSSLIATLGIIGKWQVNATEANKLATVANKIAIEQLTKSVIEYNTTNNDRFNHINNRLDINQVNGKAIVDAVKREYEEIWKSVNELEELHKDLNSRVRKLEARR